MLSAFIFVTVTLTEAFLPLLEFTVIIAVPGFLAVIFPFESTVTIFSFELFHVIFPFLEESLATFIVAVFPFSKTLPIN